jgi:hypothetical protein
MQEPKAEDDERLTGIANIALGNEPPPAAPTPGHGLGMLSPVAPTPAANAMAPPSTAPPAPAKAASQAAATPSGGAEMSTPAPAGRATLGDLQRILQTMGMPQATPGAATPGITPQQAAAALAQAMMSISGGGDAAMEAAGPLLSDVLTPEVLLSALVSPEVQQRLAPYLPEEQRTPDSLRDLVRSPQFSSQLRAFSRALQTGALDVRQFGLTHGGTALNVADFLAAIQSAAQAEEEEKGRGGDTHMADPAP